MSGNMPVLSLSNFDYSKNSMRPLCAAALKFTQSTGMSAMPPIASAYCHKRCNNNKVITCASRPR